MFHLNNSMFSTYFKKRKKNAGKEKKKEKKYIYINSDIFKYISSDRPNLCIFLINLGKLCALSFVLDT